MLGHWELWLVSSFEGLGEQTVMDPLCCADGPQVADHAEDASAKFDVLSDQWYHRVGFRGSVQACDVTGDICGHNLPCPDSPD